MKKILVFLFIFVFALFFPRIASADEFYTVDSFLSEISIRKDTSLLIKETINVNFKVQRHGIYRIIPAVYSAKGRTINSRIRIIDINDGTGKSYKYDKSNTKQSISLKIGDPDVLVFGNKTYVITYEVFNVLQSYNGSLELYWNVTGHEWDTEILSASAVISSPFAEIERYDCFAGQFGGIGKKCNFETVSGGIKFNSETPINYGDDFTAVSSFSSANSFEMPGNLQKLYWFLTDNWGYILSPLPLYMILYFWYKRGRDRKYTGANVYYKEDSAVEETKPVFAREHLPLVYHPISGLSPSEIGVLVDEKVDIEDVLAEITELARLGFFEIRKIVKKRLLGSETEYAFIKMPKYDNDTERAKLRDYQEYLLKEIFRSTIIHKSVEIADKFFKGNDKELNEAWKHLIKKDYVLLGGLKNHFYEGLPVFRDKLYDRMGLEHFFYENPEKVRGKWIGIYIAICLGLVFVLSQFGEATANYGPLVAMFLIALPGAFFAYAMPRRTPKGYSLKRQIEGLSWYLEKGKWRYEIAEKNMFIEEILPLAIALGVVDSLVGDMKEIGIKPPSYFTGSGVNTFSNDFSTFRTTSSNSIFSTPGGKWSGSSSWSGGSGFSGGSSGGGFGGGGGGSW